MESSYLASVQDQFTTLGYCGPTRVLTTDQCRTLIAEYQRHSFPLIPDWPKGLAVVSSPVYRIATQRSILEPVKGILGNDVLLWGASFVTRMPGQVHAWHNDIESSVAVGKTLSVWIGLEHTTHNSSLQLITRTQAFRESIQEVRHKHGTERNNSSAREILAWAQQKDTRCDLVVPEMTDGEALFFDGWLWHASHNTSQQRRTALLLQYATPDTPIRIPDQNNFEWPFKTLSYPKPPCIMVSGSDHFGVNRIVPPPVLHDGHEKYMLSNRIYTMDIPLQPDPDKNWKPFPIFKGSSPNLQSITCHVSALNPGHTPHPPHQHREEEILLLLNGQADLNLPDLEKKGLSIKVSINPGEFVYYPAWFYHTITAKGDGPANYIMFKWYNEKGERDQRIKGGKARELPMLNSRFAVDNENLSYGKYVIADSVKGGETDKKFYTTKIFQQATDCLHALQCHTSVLLPGGGYASHTDAHDVSILVMKGYIESLGERVGPMSVLFFPAGHPHDIHNPTNEIAEYVVFEFHGNHPPPVKRKKRSLWNKIKDPKAWKDKMAEFKSRF